MSTRVYAYLTISGFCCTPEAVEALVGLPADRVRLIGEKTRGGRTITENSWSSKPPLPPGEEPPDFYLSAVLDHIDRRPPAAGRRPPDFQQFLRMHDSGINCVGYFRRLNGGFHMKSTLVARCAELGLWLDFDLYNDVVENDP